MNMSELGCEQSPVFLPCLVALKSIAFFCVYVSLSVQSTCILPLGFILLLGQLYFQYVREHSLKTITFIPYVQRNGQTVNTLIFSIPFNWF